MQYGNGTGTRGCLLTGCLSASAAVGRCDGSGFSSIKMKSFAAADTLFQYRAWKLIFACAVSSMRSAGSSDRKGEYPDNRTYVIILFQIRASLSSSSIMRKTSILPCRPKINWLAMTELLQHFGRDVAKAACHRVQLLFRLLKMLCSVTISV